MNTQYPNFMNGFMPSYPQNNQVQYVNGLDSARSYNLRPNESVILMDANSPVFYHKQADASGYCTIKAYSFQEVKEEKAEDKYLTKKEFQEWLSTIQKQNGGHKHESSEK